MADTIRQQIIATIVSNLSNITAANGYNTDIGNNVIIGDEIGMEAELPALSVAFGVESADRKHRTDVMAIPVTIMGMARYPESIVSRQAQALVISTLNEQILGDIRKGMGQDVALSDDIMYVSGGPEEYSEPERGQLASSIEAEFLVRYRTLKNDPYSQIGG